MAYPNLIQDIVRPPLWSSRMAPNQMTSPSYDTQDKKRHKRSPQHGSNTQTSPTHTVQPLTTQTVQRTVTNPQQLTLNDVTTLQRTIGNRAVASILDRGRDHTTPSQTQPTGAHTPAPIQRSPIQRPLIQRTLWDNWRRKKKNMSDTDVVDHTRGEGGTANRVDKVRYKRSIGSSKQKLGFFKPNAIDDPGTRNEYEDVGMANRAVFSSRLDKWLGTNVLSEEIWASHNGENGSVSAMVPGSPLFENEFNTQMPEDFDINMVLDPTQYRQKDGRYYQNSGSRFNHHDFSNPQTQKGLSDLQLLDAITGQSDRHGGNIYIDPTTGKVKGIDNDIAFRKGESEVDVLNNKYHGLPSQVDKGTAKKILKKKAKNLPKVLRSKHGGSLSDKEIQDAQTRLRLVKTYLKRLKKEGKLVKKWDDSTYLHSYMEQDRANKWGSGNMEPSYTKRSMMQYAGATNREIPGGTSPTFQMQNNPLFDEQVL